MTDIMYDSMDELWTDSLAHVLYDGKIVDSRNGPSKEVIGLHVGLRSSARNLVLNPVRNLSPYYASAELLWYLSGSDRVEMMEYYAPSYRNYAEDDGHLHGAYGNRLLFAPLHDGTDRRFDQIRVIVDQIKNKPHTRQAVITLFDTRDLFAGTYEPKRDLPCTLTWQFLLREDKLRMRVNMRSNDLWLGMPYDIYVFTTIQRLVAGELGVAPGAYEHDVGSAHVYERDYDRAERAIHVDGNLWVHGPEHAYPRCGFSGLQTAIDLERQHRTRCEVPFDIQTTQERLCRENPVLGDAANCCAIFSENDYWKTHVTSPLLRRVINDHRRGNRQGGQEYAVRPAGE